MATIGNKKAYFICIIAFLGCNSIFSQNNKVLPQIIKPLAISVDKDRLYVAEISGISIISLKNFKTIRRFGKKGEGPGEWKSVIQLKLYEDFLLVCDGYKIIFFSRDGQLKKELKSTKGFRLNNLHYLTNQKFIFSRFYYNRKGNNNKNRYVLNIWDEDLEIIKDIYEYVGPGDLILRHGAKKIEIPLIIDCFCTTTYKERIYIGDTIKGFFISVFDSDGNKLYDIKKDLEKNKVTEEYKKEISKKIKSDILWKREKNKIVLKCRDFYPAFFNFYIKDDKIYVLTYKIQKNLREMIIMDLKGNIKKKVFLYIRSQILGPDLTSIYNNNFYYLFENEDEEELELHSVEIN